MPFSLAEQRQTLIALAIQNLEPRRVQKRRPPNPANVANKAA